MAGRRVLAVQVFEPGSGEAVGAVVVVPSFGFEAEVGYRTLAALAARAADAGFLVLMPDLSGYGDSASIAGVDEPGSAWMQDVQRVVGLAGQLLPDGPCSVVGYRLGAAIAEAAVDGLPEGLVASRCWWEPVSGRRFVLRQQMLFRFSQPRGAQGDADELLGPELRPQQVHSIKGTSAPRRSGARVVHTKEHEGATPVTPGIDAYGSDLPRASIDAVVQALASGRATRIGPWQPELAVRLPAPCGPEVVEHFERIGPNRLHAVLTRSASPSSRSSTWVVFTGQGTERATGPGNLWTDLARDLAACGHTCLRADRRLLGWHTDPRSSREPNPHTDDAVDDVLAAVAYARGHGARRVVVVGSCAGAWLALVAASRAPVDDVLALGVPVWSLSPERIDDSFLDYWHGVRAVEGNASVAAWRERVKERLRNRPLVWRRLLAARQVVRAAHYGSLGVPLLRAVPRRTAVSLVLGNRDLDFFDASAGRPVLALMRARRRRMRLTRVRGIDHALRTTRSREVVRAALAEVLGASTVSVPAVPQPRAPQPPDDGDGQRTGSGDGQRQGQVRPPGIDPLDHGAAQGPHGVGGPAR